MFCFFHSFLQLSMVFTCLLPFFLNLFCMRSVADGAKQGIEIQRNKNKSFLNCIRLCPFNEWKERREKMKEKKIRKKNLFGHDDHSLYSFFAESLFTSLHFKFVCIGSINCCVFFSWILFCHSVRPIYSSCYLEYEWKWKEMKQANNRLND